MAFLTGNKQTGNQEEAAKNITFPTEMLQTNVLVTGGNGQLGSELQRLADINFNNNFRLFFTDVDTLDITDIEAIDEFVCRNSIRYIVNCAAYTAVDKAEDDVELCYKINRDAIVNLGKVASKYKAKIIHISTDYVFDGNNTKPYIETDIVNPQSVYGKSKIEGESKLLEICPDSIIIRTAWLYSIYGKNFVKTMLNLGKERDELNVVADQTGTPTNAADLASAIKDILNYSEKKEFIPGIYHYTNEGITTWYDFTVRIFDEAGITACKVNPITTDQYPTKAKRPQYSVLDKTKIKNTFGIIIPTWEDSLALCVKELLNRK